MTKKRGLASNRGLDALLGSIKKEKLIAGGLAKTNVMEQPTSQNLKPAMTQKNNKQVSSEKNINELEGHELSLIYIDVNCLQRGKYQPRTDLKEETLQELATSIKQHGVMQPIVIRPLPKPYEANITHEIIAGERRWRATQIAGLSHIPAIERPISDDLAIALALIENIQREDLSIMEQARALQRFHDEFGMSHAQIADVVGKARTTVSNMLRLNQLHDEVKTVLNDGLIDMGHARALLPLSPQQQPIIAKKIIHEQLSVRQTEQLIKQMLNPQEQPKPSKEIDYERLRLNQQLSEKLGAVVKIKGSSVGKGSIEIFYHNAEELQALIEQLQGELS